MPDTIVVAGSLAQKPGHGGHTWVFLQYLLGFRRLGHRVLFLDRLEPEMCVDDSGAPAPLESSLNLRYFTEVMEGFGLGENYTLTYNQGERILGLSRRETLERVRSSACLINVMGFITDEEILGCAPRKAFLDIDPGFGQMWQDLGLYAMFRGHDSYVTIGENIGQPGCDIPTCGIDWITTPQPVVLDCWEPQTGRGGEAFTSIASWRGDYGTVEYHGKTYGLRVHEFRKFFALPRMSKAPFLLALDIHPAEGNDLVELEANGWALADPRMVAGSPDAYREFIHGSKAEFMVAKNMYVESSGGWLSDRSLCYLAAGRPVLAQETGFSRLYPTGGGLVPYATLDEAVNGVREIGGDWERHSRAARELAREFFDSDKVLARLLVKLAV